MNIKVVKITTLEKLENGSLFIHRTTLALKTEYKNKDGAIEAYIVGSGEFFWGETSTPEKQGKLKIIQVEIDKLWD